MSSTLPVIDVSSFDPGAPRTPESDAVAESIDQACRQTGFLLVDGHGINPEARAAMFEQMERFFALPVEEKEKIAIGNPATRDRCSIPMFVTPPFHARIECLPTCLSPGEKPKYEPLVAGPYLLSRFDSTHSYRNALLEQFNRDVTTAYR